MSLNSYEIFITVVEQGSFINASKILNITPSAVSHSIASLEAEVGYPLLTRSRKGIQVTNYGENILPTIRNVIHAEINLKQRIAMLNGLEVGTVCIGCFNSICNTHLPRLIKLFHEQYPGIDVKIYQGTYTDIVAWIKNGVVDLGFLSMESASNHVPFESVYKDELFCVVPKGKYVASTEFITHKEMTSEPFITQSESTDSDIQNYLHTNRLNMAISCYVTDDQAALTLVSHGYGISIMPKLVIDSMEINVDKYQLQPRGYRIIGISCYKKRLSPAAAKFYDIIINAY